jgi:glycosyltransferase involved in cell wall biosynthesis
MGERPAIAFYAPMKDPQHPAPSGDRTMARLLIQALQQAGFAPQLASALRSWDGVGEREFQQRIQQQALAEADRVCQRWGSAPPHARPRLWFTYHVYYKAPDWIGPRVADVLGIPYVVAEASRAGKRAGGPWAVGHEGAEAALDRAEIVFVMTEADRESLEGRRSAGQRLVSLPPFIDLAEWDFLPARSCPGSLRIANQPRLLTVAMMRPGDKLASYRILADSLGRVLDLPWRLDIVGDGEARGEVETLLAAFGERVTFHGAVGDRASLAARYHTADLFVWPAVNEAYGMAFLEAQAFGCPVLAGGYGGVASVVRDGATGVLTAPGDAAAFAHELRALIRDDARRTVLGEAAARFVRAERRLEHAAARLESALTPLLAEAAA